MSDWYALYTEPRKEPLAAEQLVRRGFNILFPHIPEWIGLKTGTARLVKKAYYPRYLFVSTDNLWDIRDTPGVIGLVRSTDRMPFRIAERALQRLLSLVDCLGAIQVDDLPELKCGLYRGNRIKMAEGNPLWGLEATIIDVDEAHICATMSGLFGRVMISPTMVGEVLGDDDKSPPLATSHAHSVKAKVCSTGRGSGASIATRMPRRKTM